MHATDNSNPAIAPETGTPLAQRRAQFLPRLVSSIVLWVVVLLVIFKATPVIFCLFFIGVAATAQWEFYTILQKADRPSFKYLGIFFGVILIIAGWYYSRHPQLSHALYIDQLMLLVFVGGVFFRQLPQRGNPRPFETMSNTLFGVLYVPWLLNFITKLIYVESPDVGDGDGRFFVLYLIIVTKFSDVGAYVFGSLFGRHKLIPRISPNKTWEGAVGAIIVPLGLSAALFASKMSFLERLNFQWRDALVLGALLGFIAMIGDLSKSIIKREAKVKDSGRLLPGIGGALDLVDSLLFTAPVFYVYLRLVPGVHELP
jgi:phosphatidate cytidylyltransferase